MTAARRWGLLASLAVLSVLPAEEDRRAAAQRLWTEGITDVSGLSALGPFSQVPYDPRDLQSICAMKRAVLEDALQATRDYLAHLQTAPEAQRDREAIMKLEHQLGQLAMYSGEVPEAIAHFERAYRIAGDLKATYFEHSLEEKLAIAQLRRGEVENCAHHRNPRSCILPISTEARHTKPAGSRAAAELFAASLRRDPANLGARWLLNIAHMTLGSYPQKVPPDLLISPAALTSTHDVGRFVDVGAQAGVDVTNMAGGTVVEDLDGDGLLDIVVSSQNSCSPVRFLRNRGDGFEDRTPSSGLEEQLGGLNIVSADFNNDGRPDLFVLRGGWEFPMRNSLLRNNGDGTFTDVTMASGLAVRIAASQTAGWQDYDNDGDLDIFVGNEFSPAQLFRNNGDGTFTDVAAAAGVGRTAFTKGAAWADYDNDGYADLYVSNFGEANFLYHNNRDGTFTELAGKLGVQKPERSFPVWFMDYDNDGWQDLFVSGYVQSLADVARGYLGQEPQGETFQVYRNVKGTFTDVTRQVGMARNAMTMGCNFGDIDNDGYLDFYLGTGAPSYGALVPNLLLWNKGGMAFIDVTYSAGVGHLQKGHGIAFADFDHDGDQDIFLHSGGAVPGDSYPNSLFANPGHAGNRWLELRLTGVKSNRAAIGARVKVVLPNGREIHRVVTTGTSFGGSSLRQHIGVGPAPRIARVEVYWPASQSTQVFRNIASNQALAVTELSDAIRVVARRRVTLTPIRSAARTPGSPTSPARQAPKRPPQ